MSFLALLAALIIEQYRPLDPRRWITGPADSIGSWLGQRLDAGAYRHGVIAWCLSVGVLLVAALLIHLALVSVNPLLGWLFSVAMLYWTMGFRQVSHYFSDIQRALQEGRLDDARSSLAEWGGYPAERLGSRDVAGLAVEHALLASHRQVFAVLFWFVVLPGPLGALLYRATEQLARVWRSGDPESAFGSFARTAFVWIDWLPQRITAFCFAIVGDFEDAVHCWRTQAQAWGEEACGVVLASGAGALGVRLGMPLADALSVLERPELGTGEEPAVESLQATVGLVWRALIFWMLILLALSIASWAG